MRDSPPIDRRLATLEKLLEISSTNLKVALTRAADLVTAAFRADKVDLFLYDEKRDSLVALGTSTQPLSVAQRNHGLDVLAVSNGGRVVQVFQTGVTFASGDLEHDTEELRGIRLTLQIRSMINAPFEIGGVRRGVLALASQTPNFWGPDDAHFAEAVAVWVGTLAHRAELVEELERNAVAQGRRAAAEELVMVLAHDLRGYLSPVDLRLHLLARRAQAENRPDDEREIGLARRSLERAVALIGDILDGARIDRGMLTVDVRPVDLGVLVQDLASAVTTSEHRVDVLIKESSIVPADEARLRQCLQNVISNALKYSPRNADVTVIVTREGSGGRARVEVLDQGPGIPAEVLPHIFERFVTGDQERGLGLGLFLAKQIALLHEGDLTVSTSPTGTCFALTLPCLTT